ncbi:hypothetical protein [Pseudomonas palmensis]|uniref:hypothetical protein n=1 Tax=Pseudomonas palmensis TaxID=2815362 RepID=UPI0039EAA31E
MRVPHPNGSGSKATTTPRHLQATAIVGGALIGFLVMKTPEARNQLERVTSTARRLGELSDGDAAIVSQLLATLPQLSNV